MMDASSATTFESEIRQLISELRNARGVGAVWPRFRTLVERDIDRTVNTFSIRWLVSICDTYADYGEGLTARNAMVISYFVNMLRLAETVRFTRPAIDEERWNTARGNPVELYDGVATFSIDRQDTYLNLTRRFARLLEGDHLMTAIWKEILFRLQSRDTVISEFARSSPVWERYFPVEHTGLTDNYGR